MAGGGEENEGSAQRVDDGEERGEREEEERERLGDQALHHGRGRQFRTPSAGNVRRRVYRSRLLFNREQGPRESGLMPSRHRRGLAVSPIQTPILDRLADVGNADSLPRQIGNRPRDLEHAVIGPRGETQPGDRRTEQASTGSESRQ